MNINTFAYNHEQYTIMYLINMLISGSFETINVSSKYENVKLYTRNLIKPNNSSKNSSLRIYQNIRTKFP